MIRLKVCCIASVEEARLAVALGADALGLVSAMPSGPGVISDSLVAEIAAVVPPPVATFLLTSRVDAEGLVEQALASGANTLQLVDATTVETRRRVRAELRSVKLVQVVHVGGPSSLEEARAAEEGSDAVLLDSGNPSAPVKELGGTGRVHDWEVSARIVAALKVPVFLAGGLRAENVVAALAQVRPFGVDICSGVRTDGRLDGAKLAAFVGSLRAQG